MEKSNHQLKRELSVKSHASELEIIISQWHNKLTLSELSKIHNIDFNDMNLSDIEWHTDNLFEKFSELNLLEKLTIFQSLCEGDNQLF